MVSSLSILRPLHSEHRLSSRHPSEFGSRTWWDPNMNTSGRHVGSNISGKRSEAENDRRRVNAASSRNVGGKTARKWALMRRTATSVTTKRRCFVPGVFIVKQGPLAVSGAQYCNIRYTSTHHSLFCLLCFPFLVVTPKSLGGWKVCVLQWPWSRVESKM